ncbi:MAG: hypothetical protein H0U12_11340, partial [Thermoleophilaceae bacterium]|nr:hypothetical protein [Thermoleophilaceae bacterium]
MLLGPLSLATPSARRAVFSAPPLRPVSPDGTSADAPGSPATPEREGSGSGTGGSGPADSSGDGGGSGDGAGAGASDDDASRSGDASERGSSNASERGSSNNSERGASNPSEPLFSPFESGPLAPVADAVPPSMQWLVTALGALATLVLGAALLATRRSGRAARRRRA